VEKPLATKLGLALIGRFAHVAIIEQAITSCRITLTLAVYRFTRDLQVWFHGARREQDRLRLLENLDAHRQHRAAPRSWSPSCCSFSGRTVMMEGSTNPSLVPHSRNRRSSLPCRSLPICLLSHAGLSPGQQAEICPGCRPIEGDRAEYWSPVHMDHDLARFPLRCDLVSLSAYQHLFPCDNKLAWKGI